MRNALPFFILAVLGFPFGAALALLIHWMDKQKQPPRRRSAASIPGGIAVIGITLSLPFAVLRAARHDWQGMKEELVTSVIYVLVSWGAWAVTHRTPVGPSNGPNYGDGI